VRRSAFHPGFAGFQDLFHGAKKTVRVEQHELVELTALIIIHLATLQGLQI
jgi:hypothetical protein